MTIRVLGAGELALFLLYALCLCLFAPLSALAEEELVNIVITPNRYLTSAEQVGSSVSVVESDEIESRREQTVGDLIRSVPGLEVVQAGGPGRTTTAFIRGAESDHTLVLIDGIRANDNSIGAFDFANLQADNIERIEVLRGPQSVLYGSEAIGGVINIITKKAKEGLNATVSAMGGSFGTQEYSSTLSWGAAAHNSKTGVDSNSADAGGSRSFALVSSSTSVSYQKTDGFSAAQTNNGNPEDDLYENFTLSTRNDAEFLKDGEASFTFRYSNSETEVDGFEFGVGAADDPNFVQETDSINSSLSILKPLSSWVTTSLELGITDETLEGKDPDTEFSNFDIDNQTRSLTAQADITPTWGGVLSLGYTYEHRQAENRGNFDEQRDVNSVYVQKQYAWEDQFFLTAGARYDDDSDFGDETTIRVTGAFLLPESGTRFHASYGTGFKAPSFNELFFPDFGNPELRAETSWGFDVGVEQKLCDDRASLDVTFFQNDFEDLIAFDTETFLAANIQEAEALGIETTLKLVFSEWLKAKVAYTYTDSENKQTGGILPRRPRHRGAISLLLKPTEELDAALTFHLVNSRRETDGTAMDDYEKVDLAFSYLVSENIKPFVRIENLFDEDYEELPGFGTAGFSAYGGVEFQI